jgi:ABC-type dipeptide/oligopeptide/nickel transport system permease component
VAWISNASRAGEEENEPMRMWIYVVRRILLLIPILIGVLTILFGIFAALPLQERIAAQIGAGHGGVPITPTIPCPGNSQQQCPNPEWNNALNRLGLNKPIPVQWAIYVYNGVTLNWGQTSPSSQLANHIDTTGSSLPVITVLAWYLPFTLQLAFLSLIIILVLAIPLGNYSAVYRNRPLDQGTRIMSFSGFALPGFLLSSLVLIAAVFLAGGPTAASCGSSVYNLFYGSWPSAQTSCFDLSSLSWVGIHHYAPTSPTGFPTVDSLVHGQYSLAWSTFYRDILPAVVIAYLSLAGILRYVRNSMLEVMNQDYIRTARAKGVPESQVIRKHAGRNSLTVTVAVLGLTFAFFIGGFPVIEEVFGLNGVGQVLVWSILPPKDWGMIFGTTILFTIIVVLANVIVDVVQAYLDPRIRLG